MSRTALVRTVLVRSIALAAVAALAARSTAAAQPSAAVDTRPTVAVFDFTNGSMLRHAEFEPLSKGIADLLITELAANPRVRVVERDQLRHVLDELKLGATSAVDPATAARAGRVLGAHHMIVGGFVVDPRGRMRLDARVVRTETTEYEHGETVTDKSDDVLDMIAALGRKLNDGMRLPPMPARVGPAARPASSSAGRGHRFQALMLYSRALVEEDGGRVQQARQLYQAALAQVPNYEPAQRRLARLARRT